MLGLKSNLHEWGCPLRLSLHSLLTSVCKFLSKQGNRHSLPKDEINLINFGVFTMYWASINNSSKWITYFYSIQCSGRYQTWPILSGQASASLIKSEIQTHPCCSSFNLYFGRSSAYTSKSEFSSCPPLSNPQDLGNGEREPHWGRGLRAQDLHFPISVLLFTSLWNSVGILWQKITGEQLNLSSLGLSNSCSSTAGTQQKHWLGAAPAGFGRWQLQGTHLEHSSVHVGHGSHLIHVPDPEVTHLKNERGHVKNTAQEGGSRCSQMCSSSGNETQGKLFHHPNHTGQLPSRLSTQRAFTKLVFTWKAYRNSLAHQVPVSLGAISNFSPFLLGNQLCVIFAYSIPSHRPWFTSDFGFQRKRSDRVIHLHLLHSPFHE